MKITVAMVTVVAIVAGCASVPKDAGFGDVEKSVAERTGLRVHWNQGTAADAEAAAAVRSLLDNELSVDDVVQVALLENRNLQAIYEDLGVAQADLVQAGLLKNPRFHVEIRFPERPVAPLELDLFQDFLDLFLLPLRKRQAGARFEESKLRVANAVLDLAAEVKVAFFRLQASQQLVEMRRSVVDAAAASRDAATRLHAAGNVTDLDLANEEALFHQSKLDLADAETAVLDDRESLNVLMGLWGSATQWRIAGRLPEIPPDEVPRAGLESLAISRRLDLAAARREVEATAQSLGIAKWTPLMPEAFIGIHSEREPDGLNTVGPSVDIPVPIFDQGQAARSHARSMLRQTEERFAALAIEIRSQVRMRHNQLVAARRRSEYYRRVVLPLRAHIVEETQLQYNAMQSGVFQLLQAKQSEIDAGQRYIEALGDYWRARAELERAVGGHLEAPQSKESEKRS
ncbi:MAG: TolC family protein [Planctomycetes bacterium]|nr:TolC family protein [Planctomycetota bacterium]